MKQEMQQLIKCLNTQKFLYAELLKLSEQKKDVIIKNDIETLNNIVDKEKDFIKQISAIEGLRLKCFKSVCEDFGLSETATLEQMIEKAEDAEEILSNLFMDMSNVVKKLKSVNHTNNGLVNLQLDYIDNVKNSFFSNETNNYGLDGKNVAEKKQNINIFDRTV